MMQYAVRVVLGLLVFAPVASAQTPSATQVHAVVLDQTRAPIAGARVVARQDGAPAPVSGVSDARGEVTLVLGSGRYTVRVAAAGFAEASQTVTVSGAPAALEFVLALLPVVQTVDVVGAGGYRAGSISSGTKTPTPVRDLPQSVTIVTQQLMRDQLMLSLSDVVRYVPGITAHQGENNRDQLIIRGNSSSADFFLNGVRDDVQYYRDLYNLDRVEALKGPNALIFGRGGGGGVVNRVTKEAGFTPVNELWLQSGSFGHKRVSLDVNRPAGSRAAFRVNGVYEDSASFRKSVTLERYGISPTVTFVPNARTTMTLSFEHFHDGRVADRGISSFKGRPLDLDRSTYFGNPEASDVRARADLASAMIERKVRAVTIRNRTMVGDYDRFYQNFVPGAVTADKSQVVLTAYNNATQRRNVFNQTDVIGSLSTSGIRHTLLFGVEFGRQVSNNFRATGYFNNVSTSTLVPLSNPTTTTPMTFRQSATDADNRLRAHVAAAYAQDQIQLARPLQVIAGVRVDQFGLQYQNNRTSETLERPDTLVSPRLGVVVKPTVPLSIYGSYTVSALPSSGDQFSSLTVITEQMKPERFRNVEIGAKWDVRSLALTTALYRLDRTNTRSTDPNDPTRIVQTGAQRTNGWEAGVSGHVTPNWEIAGGYTYQHAFIRRATTAAPAGAQVGQVPRHALSLWNMYRVSSRFSAGLGIVRRTNMFAAIDNRVTLEGHTKVDGAVYLSLTRKARLQANVENVFDRKYFLNADSNTNISPGAPRTVRVALVTRF